MTLVTPSGATITVASRPLVTGAIPFNKAASRVVALPDGKLVVIWGGETGVLDYANVLTSRADVFGRVLNADGTPSSGEFTIAQGVPDTSFSNGHPAPSITALGDGRFVVGVEGNAGQPGGSTNPGLQIFNESGTAASGVVRLQTLLTRYGFTSLSANGWDPILTRLADGRYAAAWRATNVDLAVRIFTSTGAQSGTDILVSSQDSATPGSVFLYDPTISSLAGGGFVLAWETQRTDGSGTSIHTRFYDAAGVAVGAEFVVNTTTTSGQHEPSVLGLSDGRFVVAWVSEDGGDGDGTCLRGRIFTGQNQAQGPDFIINTTAQGDQLVPQMAALDNGRFVVVWRSQDNGTGDIDTIRARVFEADGTALNDFTVGTEGPSDDEYPSVTALPDGRFAVSWWAWGAGSTVETKLQIFTVDGAHTTTGTAGNDSYFGGSSSDTLRGAGGNDTLTGDTGNDLLDGGTGTNTLVGSGGFDRANYSSITRSQATITHNADGTTTISSAAGGFVDTLTGVEQALFSGNVSVSIRERTRLDANGDGTSDLLLRDAVGNVLDWSMQNSGVVAGSSIGGAAGWTILGTGDFNGDGTSDILLRSASNVVATWQVSNGAFLGSGLISSNASGYGYVGTGDIDNNGSSDIVLQNGSLIAAWKLTNGVATGVAIGNAVGYGADAVGDINGDGTSDIIMHDAAGHLDAWLMSPAGQVSGVRIGSGLSGYTVAGTADFNGDGVTDILLKQIGTDYLVDLQMQNGAISAVHNLGYLAGWTLVGTGDYDNNGTADIALQSGSTVAIWNMNNGYYDHASLVTAGLTGYSIVG